MFYSNQTIDSVIGVLIGFEVIHPSIYIFANVCAYQRSKSPTKKMPKNVRRPTFLVILHEI